MDLRPAHSLPVGPGTAYDVTMRRSGGKPLILGHRGSPRAAPENTLASFEAAFAAEADGIELDLQMTADGVLVVHHDADLGGRSIFGMPLARLRALAPEVPTLSEVLDYLAGRPGAHLNIELKVAAQDGRDAALAAALAGWTGPAKEHAWVSSFDPSALARLERLGVQVPLALLVYLEGQLEALSALNVAAVHPHHSLVTPERVAAWRLKGLAIFAWTVNDPGLAADLMALGIDGLIGDDPGELVRVRDGRVSES